MKTRKDYIEGKVSHREYFAQFVNEVVKNRVINSIGKEALLKSKDEHLNDIPLKKWDSLAGFMFSGSQMIMKPNNISPIRYDKLKEANEWSTCSTLVCIYKEAAKQIIEE